MSFLSGNNNDNFLDNCQGLQDLTVTLTVTEDLVTAANNGFSLQLNCYPQPGQIPQGQSLEQSGVVGDLSLTWLQYLIIVQNGFGFEIQYWSNNAKGYATGQPWPPGYNPDPRARRLGCRCFRTPLCRAASGPAPRARSRPVPRSRSS